MAGIDEKLESAIDRAGRDQVFLMVQLMGWAPGSAPPKYVWWEAIRKLEDETFQHNPYRAEDF